MASGFITLRAIFSGVKRLKVIADISLMFFEYRSFQQTDIKMHQTSAAEDTQKAWTAPLFLLSNTLKHKLFLPLPLSSPTCRAKAICQSPTGYWDFSFCWSNSEAAQKLLLCDLNKNQWKCFHDWLAEEIQKNQALLLSHRSSLTAGITKFTFGTWNPMMIW